MEAAEDILFQTTQTKTIMISLVLNALDNAENTRSTDGLTLNSDTDSSCGMPGTRQGRSTPFPVQEGAAPASRSLLPLSLLTPLFFPSSSSGLEKSSIFSSGSFSVAFAPSGPPALQLHCLKSVSASSAAVHSLLFQIEVPELPATRPGLSPRVYRVPL